MSRAAKFTEGPMTAYSHRFGAPTSPQKPTPTVTPHFARKSYRFKALTIAKATCAARYSLSSNEWPRTPKNAMATTPLSSTMNCLNIPRLSSTHSFIVRKHVCTRSKSPLSNASSRFRISTKTVLTFLCSAKWSSGAFSTSDFFLSGDRLPESPSCSKISRTEGTRYVFKILMWAFCVNLELLFPWCCNWIKDGSSWSRRKPKSNELRRGCAWMMRHSLCVFFPL
mmetsp:Transcript_16576/g.47289  ORF Transcript_16576/g.47289 Transcript_16576/m.47289 type:complete len:225 (-) Transcript_16576:944-1618(-)